MNSNETVVDEVNKMLAKMFPRVTMPRWRYFRIRGDHYAFGWTTEKTSDGKFWAFIYRITKKRWKLIKKVSFGRRKIAKARALKWYHQRQEKLKAKANQ